MESINSVSQLGLFEFHIAGRVRRQLDIYEGFFSTDGRIIFANFQAVRELSYKLNKFRNPEAHVYPGELNAAGLLDEVFHLLLRHYEREVNPGVFEKARKFLANSLKTDRLRHLLLDFVEQFPPMPVYLQQQYAADWLDLQTQGRSHEFVAIEELLMVLLANINPATSKFRDIFDRKYLENQKLVDEFFIELEIFFKNEPTFGPDNQDIISLLKMPIQRFPNDIQAQLEMVLSSWKHFIPDTFVVKLLKARDLMKEDYIMQGVDGGGGGASPTFVPFYKGQKGDGESFLGKSGYDFVSDSVRDYEEHEAFTPDTHWMPRVVLMAKNIYVWLDQISKKYGREIKRLDQIPDEELDQLASWNFNGLWLIGLWERSNASKRIKHLMGNMDAVSSAYSLYDYQVAADLGGEDAYRILDSRARARGIRLASDMVPNHTGIFSDWVINKPDYFIQTNVPPYPAYQFTGENLSSHPDIEIRIENGYYSKTDAAVVFQRIDKRYNDIRYIYHGNDGTNMPWNDTAQLDMLKQEVREAVIQKIFEVARRFSIIRFDAAMTLAKKHFARLWYPRPGTGGDIPSRSDYAMSQSQFDEMFPVEFWREVVDRMNQELPETLLLAEAFWFMEGYFVRTLGMHRVYNSAFMHMLNNEENEKYRDLITNTLEFEPEILKRYVNFMSNPDEETAIRQFGTGDKYFGICVLMCTLPGLPMFAHGQIEGFTEKYGMEYQRAYYNEEPQQWLVEKHQKEIFPLLNKRFLFSEVENFNFFDFYNDGGNLDESVMAFCNSSHGDRAVVLYNNKYEPVSGRFDISAPKIYRDGITRNLKLAEALALNHGQEYYYAFKEHISGLEYLRSGKELYQKGLHWALNGFEYRVFWQFNEIVDKDGFFNKLNNKLGGRGVESLEKEIIELKFEKVFIAFESLFKSNALNPLMESIQKGIDSPKGGIALDQLFSNFSGLAKEVKDHFGLESEISAVTKEFDANIKALKEAYLYVKELDKDQVSLKKKVRQVVGKEFLSNGGSLRENLIIAIAYLAKKALNGLLPQEEKINFLKNGLQLQFPLQRVLAKTGKSPIEISQDVLLLDALSDVIFDFFDYNDPEISAKIFKKSIEYQENPSLSVKANQLLRMLSNESVKRFIGTNTHQGVIYYSKESFEQLLGWMFDFSLIKVFGNLPKAKTKADPILIGHLSNSTELYSLLSKISDESGYKLLELEKTLKKHSFMKE